MRTLCSDDGKTQLTPHRSFAFEVRIEVNHDASRGSRRCRIGSLNRSR